MKTNTTSSFFSQAFESILRYVMRDKMTPRYLVIISWRVDLQVNPEWQDLSTGIERLEIKNFENSHSEPWLIPNIAMKTSSCTGTQLNWRRNSKKQDDSVEDLILCYVMLELLSCLLSWSRNWGNAQCILVRWKRGSSQRRALWSAENEALPQCKALWSAESEAKNHGKISNFPTFLLY